MDVTNRFLVREDIERLGIAALTSMVWFSETDKLRRFDVLPVKPGQATSGAPTASAI